jgi:predicted nucleotidyltransferase
MEKYIDFLTERAEMIRNWDSYVVKIARAAKSILPDAKVYVFGSVLRGEAVGGSDVDILIVSKCMPRSNIERAEIKLRIEGLVSLPPHHPFELHLADEREMEWYAERVKELKEYGTTA